VGLQYCHVPVGNENIPIEKLEDQQQDEIFTVVDVGLDLLVASHTTRKLNILFLNHNVLVHTGLRSVVQSLFLENRWAVHHIVQKRQGMLLSMYRAYGRAGCTFAVHGCVSGFQANTVDQNVCNGLYTIRSMCLDSLQMPIQMATIKYWVCTVIDDHQETPALRNICGHLSYTSRYMS